MLQRVNSALFEAPPGAEIRVVTETDGNNGVNEPTFEYDGVIIETATILGLPGCRFTVGGVAALFQTFVTFDPAAPATARCDLFEVEDGSLLDLGKSVTHGESAPLIGFTLDPVGALVTIGLPKAAKKAAKKAKKASKKVKKLAKKAPATKQAAEKRAPAKRATKASKATTKTAKKAATRKAARKTAARPQVSRRRPK